MERYLFRSWWVIVFLLLCYAGFERASAQTQRQISKLKERVTNLGAEITRAKQLQVALETQLRSQDDPEWVDLVLRKRMGVVPDGSVKVFFVDGE